MEKELFEQRLESLGHFKRSITGSTPADPNTYQDLVFIPVNQRPICPACDQGHYLTFERKGLHRNHSFWRVKCWTCKDTWQEKTLKISK